MTPVTVIVPCKDELPNIQACLDSVKSIADELLVADSGSTDGTLELVQSRGDCRIIQREYVNESDFKNWAIPQAKHAWILLLDADEQASPELVEEIRAMKEAGLDQGAYPAYWIARSNWFLGKRIRYSGWQSDGVVRLFRRSSRYEQRSVHAEIEVPPGRLGKLKHSLLHNTFRSFAHYTEKMNRYTNLGAQDLYRKGKRTSLWMLFARPLSRFFRHYLLKGGILDGKEGLIISAGAAYSVFLKYAKLYELQTLPNRPASIKLPVNRRAA